MDSIWEAVYVTPLTHLRTRTKYAASVYILAFCGISRGRGYVNSISNRVHAHIIITSHNRPGLPAFSACNIEYTEGLGTWLALLCMVYTVMLFEYKICVWIPKRAVDTGRQNEMYVRQSSL